MPDYRYQHEIFYQYTFGSTAFLTYMTVVNLADFKINRQRLSALVVATVISVEVFATVVIPKAIKYPIQIIEYNEHYQSIRDVLDTVPDDASVTATTYYTTHLSQREILYDVRYCSQEHMLETEYVVLAVSEDYSYQEYATDGKNNGYENLTELLKDNGYSVYESIEDVLVIWHKG